VVGRMKRIMYFIKWNFTDMQPYSKRMLAYFAIAILGAIFVHEDLFFLAPVLIFIDLTQDIVRSRYQDFKDEQQKIIKDLSK
jgi:hypothetical protein